MQELEIGTGRVLFEWHSAPEVAVDESYADVPRADKGDEADAYDYFHINSVDEDDDGNFLVSARNTHAVYKISRDERKVMWRLGGKRSDFAMGPGVRFAWQHDARRQPDGTLTLYDNVSDDEAQGALARARAAARRRCRAGDARAFVRASATSCWRRPRATPSSWTVGTCSWAGARSRTSPSSIAPATCSSTGASESTGPTRTARTGWHGRGGPPCARLSSAGG